MLAELFGELAEEALPGFEDLGLIVGEPLFDVIHALDHDAPEEDGELVRQGLVGDEAAGFKLVAEGNFLRNPNDPRDKNTPDPPMPKDEFVLKFAKP